MGRQRSDIVTDPWDVNIPRPFNEYIDQAGKVK